MHKLFDKRSFIFFIFNPIPVYRLEYYFQIKTDSTLAIYVSRKIYGRFVDNYDKLKWGLKLRYRYYLH